MNKIEKAINLLVEFLPPSNEDSKKPILFHDIRVGTYLYENNYSEDIVIAGFLHDMIEWSDVYADDISKKFGDTVLDIILANSKDRNIEDKDEQIKDLVERCAKLGEDALIVKAADTIDSFKHYTKTKNQSELKYCAKNALAVLQYKTDDKIFNELEKYDQSRTN